MLPSKAKLGAIEYRKHEAVLALEKQAIRQNKQSQFLNPK